MCILPPVYHVVSDYFNLNVMYESDLLTVSVVVGFWDCRLSFPLSLSSGFVLYYILGIIYSPLLLHVTIRSMFMSHLSCDSSLFESFVIGHYGKCSFRVATLS